MASTVCSVTLVHLGLACGASAQGGKTRHKTRQNPLKLRKNPGRWLIGASIGWKCLSTMAPTPVSKFHAFMKNPTLSLLLLAALVGIAPLAQAEKADRNKPMNIEADALRYDDVKQISVFSGHVVLTKGTILVRGALLEVRQDPDGYQFAMVVGSPESPAFFRQKREGLDEFIEGESETIEYDGRADKVKFIKKAHLRRLRGATVADEISGALIVYENLTDMFSVDGVPRQGGVPVPGGRVRAVLTPKPEGAAATPAAAPATLNPSTTLGSVPQ